jgi:hypothetical protein
VGESQQADGSEDLQKREKRRLETKKKLMSWQKQKEDELREAEVKSHRLIFFDLIAARSWRRRREQRRQVGLRSKSYWRGSKQIESDFSTGERSERSRSKAKWRPNLRCPPDRNQRILVSDPFPCQRSLLTSVSGNEEKAYPKSRKSEREAVESAGGQRWNQIKTRSSDGAGQDGLTVGGGRACREQTLLGDEGLSLSSDDFRGIGCGRNPKTK